MAKKPIIELLDGVTRFGKLTVIAEASPVKSDRRALCRCECGVTKPVYVSHLRRGNSRSCGCEIVRGKPKHGLFYHPLYGRWNAMIQRCSNPKHRDYPNYGARGIRVCDRWLQTPANFITDMGPCPDGMSLDRKDSNGNYEPSNCRWATDNTQAQNKRATRTFRFRGEDVCLAEACRRAGVQHRFFAIYKRLSKGAHFADAFAKEGVEV